MHFAHTGNVLIQPSVFDATQSPVSERFARFSGAACIVHEAISGDRMRIGWTVRRELRADCSRLPSAAASLRDSSDAATKSTARNDFPDD